MVIITKLRQLWTGRSEGLNPADWPWRIALGGAAILLLISAFLPLWHMTLQGPQYPGGLELTAYGTHMEGPIDAINDMNRYIGMAPLEPDEMLELKLFPVAIGLAVALLLLAAAIVPRRSVGIAVRLIAPAFPIAFLADLQFWLYRYGQDLDPTAPFRVDPFTPTVIGTTELMQFRAETMVESGFWLMVAAAVLAIAGPLVMRFLRDSWQNTEPQRAIAVGLVIVGAAVFALAPGQTTRADVGNETTISELIEAAEPGDTIRVPAGTYTEQVRIDRPLTLIADGKVIIDGGGVGDVVVIAAPDVTFDGFIVQNTARAVSQEPTGIRVGGDNATVRNNTLRDTLYGIVLQYSNGHHVHDNHVTSITDFPVERRGHAIYLYYSSDNVIEDNFATMAKDGIFVGFGHRNSISNNHMTDLRYGIHYMYSEDNVFTDNVFRNSIAGAALMYSEGLTLTGNEFSYNTSRASGYGLLIKEADDLVIVGNKIHHNRLGMTLESVPRSPHATALIADNLIGFNQTGASFFSNTRITFTGNTFIGNLRQVEGRGDHIIAGNEWALDGRGNYWDTYQGYDASGDGIGDRPYEHRTVYESLMEEHPALQAYAFTLAHQSIELAARWFAPTHGDPILTDPAPLMKPSTVLPGGGSASDRWKLGAVSLATLTALGLVAYRGRHTLVRRWQPC